MIWFTAELSMVLIGCRFGQAKVVFRRGSLDKCAMKCREKLSALGSSSLGFLFLSPFAEVIDEAFQLGSDHILHLLSRENRLFSLKNDCLLMTPVKNRISSPYAYQLFC
jgi:hypothetical protein